MIFYHFTAAHLLDRILERGLTLGVIFGACAGDGKVRLLPEHQWLTKDGTWTGQHWAKALRCNYDRTAWRLTLHLADDAARPWTDYRASIDPHVVRELESVGGSEHWWIHQGPIPRSAIMELSLAPNMVLPGITAVDGIVLETRT